MQRLKNLPFFRHDWRITFINLKKEGTRINLIGEEDRNKIWIPELIFDNGLTDSKVVSLPIHNHY